ncbi:MAG TPA: hypothetical protein VMW23_10480 [Sedimentisphaerales bacterium]|nr:hypothetical protein [Sedimentisphaerales bacterium]
MKKYSLVTYLFAVMCFLTGCTNYWYQEGKTFDQCKGDYGECFSRLQEFSSLLEFGDYEFGFLENCLGQKGYRLVTEEELPFEVKRLEPNSSLHWRLQGVAGTLETP